ncbi:MAG: hypothetical protein PHW84_04000 [Methanosarcina sp.]|nr:hypothetical protein [Methanosarcina sp.]
MTQSLVAGNLKGLGIVPVLFVMGIILIVSKINVDLGQFAIKASVGVAVGYALLGMYGIINKYQQK